MFYESEKSDLLLGNAGLPKAAPYTETVSLSF